MVIDYNLFESKNMTSMKEFIKLSPINMLSINYCKLGDVGGVAIGEAIQLITFFVPPLQAIKLIAIFRANVPRGN